MPYNAITGQEASVLSSELRADAHRQWLGSLEIELLSAEHFCGRDEGEHMLRGSVFRHATARA
jgi:hypothetical protein